MLLKQVNVVINVTSQVLRFVVLIYGAVIVAKFTWWGLEPSTPDVYVAPSDIRSLDDGVKFIINRAPFGVVATPSSYKPAIASEIKLTGVYVAGESGNSLAFYELDNKAYIAKIGDSIGGSAILKSVSINRIILSENNMDGEVGLSIAKGSAGRVSTKGNLSNSRDNFPNNRNSGNSSDYSSQPGQNSTNDVVQRRRMIEEFLHKENKKADDGDHQDQEDDHGDQH
jgi:hypothetical protein